MCLFKNDYMPILTYGTETWRWKKTNISKLTAAEMRFVRSIRGKTRRE
jgi:hypothetical protein